MQVLDESRTPILIRYYFQYLVDNSHFPALRLLNYSHTDIASLPREIREWRVHFAGAPLEMVDLSDNFIQDVDHIPPHANPSPGLSTTINLQNNLISSISVDKFEEWALVPDLYVDIRNNPVHCSSDLKDGLLQMGNDTRWAGPVMARYKHDVSVMRCATPPELAGQAIGSL